MLGAVPKRARFCDLTLCLAGTPGPLCGPLFSLFRLIATTDFRAAAPIIFNAHASTALALNVTNPYFESLTTEKEK